MRLGVIATLLGAAITAAAAAPQPISIAAEYTLTWGKRHEFKVDIPRVPAGYHALVYFLGRQDAKTLGGSTPMLTIYFNGTLLDRSRLANKSDELRVGSGAVMHWFGGASWRLLYSPDFKQGDGPGDSSQDVVTGKAYAFMLDVTNLVKPGENTLTVKHLWPSPWKPVILKDLSIVYRRPDELYSKPGLKPQAPTGPLPYISPAPVHPLQYTAEIAAGGGITIKTGGQVFNLASDFSYPGGGHNLFTCGGKAPSGQGGWEVSGRDGLHVRGQSQLYEVRRQIEPESEYLEVSDEIVNRSDEDLGIIVKDSAAFSPQQVKQYRLGGLLPTIPSMRKHSSGNQTSFVSLGGWGLGLLPRDDVFKAQSVNSYDHGTLALEDPFFAIPAHGSYTLKWAIFPVPGGNYYTFINAARRALNVNFTIDGPFGFSHYVRWMANITPADARRWCRNRSLHYVSNVIPTFPHSRKYAHGSAMLMPEMKPQLEKLRDINAAIKRACPGVVSLCYFHCYISTEPNAAEKYADSIARDSAGNQYNYHNPAYPEFVPTLQDSYGKAMEQVINLLLDDLKFDGIYWDEMSHSSAAYVFNWPQWDGHTAQIDPQKFTIIRKMSAVTLLSQPFREAMVKRILGGGHALVANGPPVTATMMQFHYPRFVETGGPTAMYNDQLWTPIGLGDSLTERTPQDIANDIRKWLNYGCVYYFYNFEPRLDHPYLTRYMYPITPIEIHDGYILAKERILTNKAGIFGWGDKCQHEVHVFDETGKEVPFKSRTFDKNGATWTELRLPTGYVAAIVRK